MTKSKRIAIDAIWKDYPKCSEIENVFDKIGGDVEVLQRKIEEFAIEEKLEMLKIMLENDSISKENYNYYYQKFCRKPSEKTWQELEEEFIGVNTVQTDRICLTCHNRFNFDDAYYPDENDLTRCLCPKCFTGNHAACFSRI